jgi:hypothetical protein
MKQANTTLSVRNELVIEAMLDHLRGIRRRYHKRGMTPEEVRMSGRLLSTHIFEFTSVYSGMTSRAALLEKYEQYKLGKQGTSWTEEHMFPRQLAGKQLVEEVLDGTIYDFNSLLAQVTVFSQVHQVTSNENQLLKRHQRLGTFTNWKTAYKKAGIELLKWPKGMRIQTLPDLYPKLFTA